jgi:hypothetical protein
MTKAEAGSSSMSFFEIDADRYSHARDRMLEPITGAPEQSYDLLACRVDLFTRLPCNQNAVTYLTNGLGAFPVRDQDHDGFVSREIAVSSIQTVPSTRIIALIEAILEELLDRHAVPSDGACFDWPDLFDSAGLNCRFRSVYFGKLLIPDRFRKLSIPGVPETLILEVVPLKEVEVADLEGTDESVNAYFRRTGIDPTDLDR